MLETSTPPQGGFVVLPNPNTIKIIICLIIALSFLQPVNAQSPPDEVTYSDNFVEAYYTNEFSKFRPDYLYPPISLWDSCVNFFKWRVGIVGTLGNASNIAPNAQNATIGGGILFDNHIAYIEDINGDVATISETNWVHGKFTIRKILLTDPRIRGYYKTP